jgi:hypothetical protein
MKAKREKDIFLPREIQEVGAALDSRGKKKSFSLSAFVMKGRVRGRQPRNGAKKKRRRKPELF